MRLRVWVAAMALATTATVYADDPKAAAAPSADEQAAMAAMMKAATPGEAHQKLNNMAGTWDTKVIMWMAPGAPPAESTGTSVNEWILGGRYMEQKFSGNFMGMPFNGLGYTGYDNVKKQYIGTWMDSISTGMMLSTGSAGAGNTWTFKGTTADPMSGKDMPFEEKVTVTDADHHMMEMWGPGPDGKMFKWMEIRYTRKK